MSSDDEEMEVNQEESENSSDDESTGSSEEHIDDEKQEKELAELQNLVQANPYNYQSHIDYITLARQYGQLEHLRSARRAMAEIFPLTQQLWLDWIRDEKQLLLSTNEENKEFLELFERAINDYLSVMIWIEYIESRISYYISLNSIDQFRNLCERGLSSCGVHLTEGSLLWAAYIEAEKAILDGILLNYSQNKENNELKNKICQHVDYIAKLYHRQLSVPLRGMKTIYEQEYLEFCQQHKEYLPANYHENNDSIVKRDFEQALKHLEQCEQFEEELDQTTRSVATYKKYITFEKEPARIQCLYERAIVDNCLDGELWLSYIRFAEEYLSSNTVLQSIYERSLRNCPWVTDLWIHYTEYMELTKLADHLQLKQMYDRALNSDPTNLISFVKLQLAYFQYRRRHYHQSLLSDNTDQCEILKKEIRRACECACDQYQELFLSSNDPNLFLKYNAQLELYWIHLELKSFQAIDQARHIWNGRTLMNQKHNQIISNLWKAYYYMEINYGDEEHARKVLYRAFNNIEKMDYPLGICDLLLEHEQKYGTIQQLKETQKKLHEIKSKLVLHDQPKRQVKQTNANKKKQNNKEKAKQVKSSSATNSKVSKMDTASSVITTNGKTVEQQTVSPRKRKLSPEETQTTNKKPVTTVIIDSEGFKIPPIPAAPSSSATSTSSATFVSNVTNDADRLNTVFIANLAFEVDEDAIRQALSPAGLIKDIRIVKHEWSGKSKGFGYVDFATAEGCRQALKLDHTLINGRPIYVSAYDPNKSASNDITKKFKYATNLEQNKLFISNLPFSTTKEQLENLFKEKGFQTKDIRIVTHKSGKSKGLAYAEFNNAHDASQALVKFDGFEIDTHTIKVAISNPPPRKEPMQKSSLVRTIESHPVSLGEAPKSSGPRGKGHSQIALIPRKIASKSTTSNVSTSTSTTTATNTMNNNDFRNMLLSKK